MKEFTLVRNHSAARSVTRNSETQGILRSMKESTTNEKPYSCARCDKAFRDLTELSNMKEESTLYSNDTRYIQ